MKVRRLLKREFEQWCLDNPKRRCIRQNGRLCALAKFIKDTNKDACDIQVGTDRVTYTFDLPEKDVIKTGLGTKKYQHKKNTKLDVDYIHTLKVYRVSVCKALPPWARTFVRYFDKLPYKGPTGKHAFQVLCEFS